MPSSFALLCMFANVLPVLMALERFTRAANIPPCMQADLCWLQAAGDHLSLPGEYFFLPRAGLPVLMCRAWVRVQGLVGPLGQALARHHTAFAALLINRLLFSMCLCLLGLSPLHHSTFVIIPPCLPVHAIIPTQLQALHGMHCSTACAPAPSVLLARSAGQTGAPHFNHIFFPRSCCMDDSSCFLAILRAPRTRLVGLGLHGHVHVALALWYMAHTEL
jgi:hypothetical protein